MTLGAHDRCWTKIELIQWVEPPVEPRPPASTYAAGISRIALRTRNLLAFVAHLKEQGIEFEREPEDIDIVGARRFALFRDPDGILLELVEF